MPIDPGTLRILHYPALVLRARAAPVQSITPEIRAVATRMLDLMYQAEGIGLAAPQVGLPWRLFVADIPEREGRSASADPPTATRGAMVFVNPELSEPRGEITAYEEGCLSLPDIRGDVLRPSMITVAATTLEGEPLTLSTAGLLARCVQHEVDHLDGVLIIDRMVQMSRLKNRAAIRDLEREGEQG